MTGVADRDPQAWDIAAVTVGLALGLCVALAVFWASPAYYEAIVGVPATQLTDLTTGQSVRTAVPVVEIHAEWLAYVTGRADQQARGNWFTDDERRHMSDVRTVFMAAQLAGGLGLALVIALSLRALRDGRLARLLRPSALAAATGMVAIGVAAALAFDAAFLLFHEVLFPQGNFLFAPGSNLLVIYPEAYWFGITVRIAVSVLVITLAIAGIAHVALRSREARSAIVTTR